MTTERMRRWTRLPAPVTAAVTAGLILVMVLVAGCAQDSVRTVQEADPPVSDVPAPAEQTQAPATTSGPLSKSDLPDAADLGRDWEPEADAGGGHGYQGNGSFVRERGPREVAMSLVPLGCAEVGRAPQLPVPEHALEATFRKPQERAAVALVLEYADQAGAQAMVERLGRLLARCPRPDAEVDRPTLVVDLSRPDENTIHDLRREIGPGASPAVWSEVVVRRGNRVGLTIVQSDHLDFDGLASSLRAAVG